MIVAVDAAAGMLAFDTVRTPCAIGRGGACPAADKREGDGCTPLGEWPVRTALLRRDRGLAPPPRLPWRWLRPGDGWSDDPRDPAYNHAVTHPHAYSAEQLWREDTLYDAIVVLGHNDAPAVPGRGSAIFLHLRIGETTAGCVAIDREAMAALLAVLSLGDVVRIG